MTDDDARADAHDFDHLDPQADPEAIDAALAAFRQQCPVVHLPRRDAYLVASDEHVAEVGKRADEFSAHTTTTGASRDLDRQYEVVSPLFDQDPDTGHTLVRRALQPFFTPRAARSWESYARQITRELMADLLPRGKCEAVTEICYQLPWLITAALLGVPSAERATYRDRAKAHFLRGETEPFDQFLTALISAKRREPGEDLISTILTTPLDDSGRLPTDTEVLRFGKIMSGAGSLTSSDSLASILLHLAEDPALRKQMTSTEPELLPRLVDEVARTQAAVAYSGRQVRKPTTLAGVDLQPGDRIIVSWLSAGRDEQAHDNADEVRLDRRVAAHAGWGRGAHRCLGREVAMVVLPAIISELLTAIPEYRLDPAAAPPRRTVGALRGVQALPIAWDRTT